MPLMGCNNCHHEFESIGDPTAVRCDWCGGTCKILGSTSLEDLSSAVEALTNEVKVLIQYTDGNQEWPKLVAPSVRELQDVVDNYVEGRDWNKEQSLLPSSVPGLDGYWQENPNYPDEEEEVWSRRYTHKEEVDKEITAYIIVSPESQIVY